MSETSTPVHSMASGKDEQLVPMASQLITRRSPRLKPFSTILGDACQVDDTFARVVGATTPTIVPQPRQASLLLPFSTPIIDSTTIIMAHGTTKGKLRTNEEIATSRDHDLPIDWPCGPWLSHFDARDKLSAHFEPSSALTLDSFKQATSKSGAKAYLLCHRHRKPTLAVTRQRVRGGEGAACKWKISIEESKKGWVISKVHSLNHTHDLVTSRAEALAQASLRSIPIDLCAFGDFLKQAGMSPVEILKYGLLLVVYVAWTVYNCVYLVSILVQTKFV